LSSSGVSIGLHDAQGANPYEDVNLLDM